jgi:ABC-type uncharacterized transport system substrate-binding protein
MHFHQWKRRDVITLLGGATAWPLAARALQPTKIWRIGLLVIGELDSPDTRPLVNALRQGLHERGYTEGTNIVLVSRAADGDIARLPRLAEELVALKADLIIAVATPGGRAAQRATSTIPVVVAAMGDPVGDGLVASLARPGGNITGTSFLGPELVPKRLALLKDIVPTLSRVAVLRQRDAFGERTMAEMEAEIARAAGDLGLRLQFVEVRGGQELESAFAAMAEARAEGLFLFPSQMLFAERRRIVALAERHRLPAMYNGAEFVKLGGLMAYGASISEITQRTTAYVERILKGAKPSDLPVEQPTRYDLAVNLRTARTLGLTVPDKLLATADEVIE